MATINKAQKSKRKAQNFGFTLVEMLVVVGVVAVVGMMAVNLFFATLKGSTKTAVLNEVKQNGDYALSVMEKMVRNAKSLSPLTGQTGTITIINPDGGTTRFSCLLDGSVRKIASNSAALTSQNVTLASCPADLFTVTTVAGKPSVVTIKFTLIQATVSPSRPEERASMDFQTTVSLRTY